MKKSIVVHIIEVTPHPTEKVTNFDIRIDKEEAERILRSFGYRRNFDIMCKEYGDDDEWVGLCPEDLDSETGKLPENYQTFEIWYN
ncbi:MAG TPA: hypothetical protein VIM55_10325 [Mucilaginibacter sp.]